MMINPEQKLVDDMLASFDDVSLDRLVFGLEVSGRKEDAEMLRIERGRRAFEAKYGEVSK